MTDPHPLVANYLFAAAAARDVIARVNAMPPAELGTADALVLAAERALDAAERAVYEYDDEHSLFAVCEDGDNAHVFLHLHNCYRQIAARRRLYDAEQAIPPFLADAAKVRHFATRHFRRAV